MVVNKHSSFYMRNGWGSKILLAINEDKHIFSPSKEQEAVDNIGVGRIMIKALRYWSTAMGLTTEGKDSEGIVQEKTNIFKILERADVFFQKQGSLLLMHRSLALNKEEATAWYWFFNEWGSNSICKEEFIEAFYLYLTVNGVSIRKAAVDKEYNCLRSTYIGDDNFDLKNIMDEDTYPFLAPLKILYVDDNKRMAKRLLNQKDIPLEILIYCIAMDNIEESKNSASISIDKLMEERYQIGKYFNMKYSKLMDFLLEAENKGYIVLNNNFGNRYVEFVDREYNQLLDKYYIG